LNAAPSRLQRWVRAGLLTGVVDAAFSSILVTAFYGSTFARLWQRVASTLIGAGAVERGNAAVAIGLVMHFGVAFGWSFVFLVLYESSAMLRRVTASLAGVIGVAFIYGPMVWLVMSLLVIPTLTGQPPVINFRWFVQLAGHIPFVALPIVWVVSRPHLRTAA
jgi:hypothetical protein